MSAAHAVPSLAMPRRRASWYPAAVACAALALACSGTSEPRTQPVDAAIDSPPDLCAPCRSDQLCVVQYDGVCGPRVKCAARTVDCPDHACSPACQAAYCDAPFQCGYRPCTDRSLQAFTCQGP
jgi:hypothetical protein